MSDLTLAEFLTARLDEDEDAWNWYIAEAPSQGPQFVIQVCDDLGQRMLREVGAGRKILDLHAPGYPVTYPEPSGQPTCGVCHAGGWDWDPEKWPCATIRALTAVFSDHPDYREEWAAD